MKYVEITEKEVAEFNAKKAEIEELKKQIKYIQAEEAKATIELFEIVDKLYKKYSPAFKGMLIDTLEYEFEKNNK